MPIDPRIALGTQTPQLRSPVTTLGALSQLREHQELVRQRDLMNQQRQRELDDDYAVRETLGRFGGNYDGAIDDLYRQGRSSAAGALAKQVYDERQAKATAMKTSLENAHSKFKMLTQIANSVTDQKSLDMARPAARALLVPMFGEEQSDAMLQQLGTEYDAERIKQARIWGTDNTDLLRQQQDAIVTAQKAMEIAQRASSDMREREKAMIEADKYWNTAASGLLSTAKSQDDWAHFQRLLIAGGARAETLARFGNQYSPEAVERAKKLGLSQKDIADIAHQKAEERISQGNLDERRRDNDRQDRENGTGSGAASRGLTANRRSELEEKKSRAYADLEKEIRERVGYGEAPEDLRAEMGQRKLMIENAYRSEMGMPTLEESELRFAADPSKRKELEEVRHKYRRLTGEDSPLAQMEQLTQKIVSEKDPRKKAALKDRLKTLRTQYREMTGR